MFCTGNKFTVYKEWKQLDYLYPSDADRQRAIKNGEFIPKNILPIDVDVFYKPKGSRKVFVTVPRFFDGIPATLSTVKDVNGKSLLNPYPEWSWHKNLTQCKPTRIVSAFRTQMDECGRLWVIDDGKIGQQQVCPPQILVFDPDTDNLIYSYEIPSDQILCTSRPVTLSIDIRDPNGDCIDIFVYIADAASFSLFVLDVINHKSWRINNKLFYPMPQFGTFSIAGQSFELMDGISGLALSPYLPENDRILYFNTLSSNTQNWVRTSILRNSTLFQSDPNAVARKFSVYKGKRSSQTGPVGIDQNGVMYFGLVSQMSMMCWYTGTEFHVKNFHQIDRNTTTLQFVSGLKIVNNPNGNEEVWILTDRVQKFWTGTYNFKQINFRIRYGSTQDLLKGTKCI